jgi:glutathione synthase
MILFIIDRVELKYFEFNDLVTNFWLIEELLERGEEVQIATIDNLGLHGYTAWVSSWRTYLQDGNIFYEKEIVRREINDFSLVIFRPDPPVDVDYINATYIFDFVNVPMVNDPRAIRNFNEKLHALKFAHLMPENIVSASQSDIVEFLDVHGEIVIKPLNGCFGKGVMYIKHGDKNTRAVINSLTNNQSTLVMVQKYLAHTGDKRVLFLGGEVLDYAVRKLPDNNDFKFNNHCEKNIVKDVLSLQEKSAFLPLAKQLNKMGLPLVGLDVIDGKIIEINVTSPCYFIKEINTLFGVQLEKQIVDFITKDSRLLSPSRRSG